MKTTIVEKILIQGGTRQELYAVATSERVPQSVCASLTYEAHLTPWQGSRAVAEALQREIEGLPAFKVTRNDGTSYVTSMAHGTTLETAKAYFLGKRFTDEAPGELETWWTAIAVEQVTDEEAVGV